MCEITDSQGPSFMALLVMNSALADTILCLEGKRRISALATCVCACKQRMPVHKHTFLLACEIHLTYIVISEFPASVGADSLLEIWRAEP